MSTTTYTAADEIDRRATNRALKAEGHPGSPFPKGADQKFLNMSGSALAALVATKAKPAKAESPKVPGTHPNKGKSVLGLTKAQIAARAKVIAQMETEGLPIKGDEYHARMAAAGVPTRRTVKV